MPDSVDGRIRVEESMRIDGWRNVTSRTDRALAHNAHVTAFFPRESRRFPSFCDQSA